MAGGGPVNQSGSQSMPQYPGAGPIPSGAQSMLASNMQSLRRINPMGGNNAYYASSFPSPYGGGNPFGGFGGGYGDTPFSRPPQPDWMRQAQEAQQNFQQSSPYTEYMNKQKALQEEFENSQGYKDFQTQMQGFQKQQQEYRPPFGFYGGLGRFF